MYEPIELYLNGTFYEMGEQYVNLLGERLLAQLDLIQKEYQINDKEVSQAFQAQLKMMLDMFQSLYPPEIIDFFKGMSESALAKRSNLSLKDFIYLDLAVFIASIHPVMYPASHQNPPEHCSTFVLTQDGASGLGRNLDWLQTALYALTTYPVIVHLKCTMENYSREVTVLNHSGSICGFTLFNDKGLSWSLNSAAAAFGMSIRLDRTYSPADALVKMFQLDNFKSLTDFVMKTPADYPSIVNIIGPETDEFASIEKCPSPKNKNFINLIRAPGLKTALKPEDDVTSQGYAQTNLLHLRWEEALGESPVNDTLDSIGRARERFDNLKWLIDSNIREEKLMRTLKSFCERRLDDEILKGATKILPLKSIYQDALGATYYSVIFHPSKCKAKVTFYQKENAQSETTISGGWMKFFTHTPKNEKSPGLNHLMESSSQVNNDRMFSLHS